MKRHFALNLFLSSTLIVILSLTVLRSYFRDLLFPSLLSDSLVSTKKSMPQETKETEKTSIKVLLTGDIMLGRTVMTKSLDMGDVNYPFLKVAEKLRSADIVFSNLEVPFVKNCPRVYEGFQFCALPEMARGLGFAGIDVVSLANNHTSNFGQEGVEQTKTFLQEEGIMWTGLGQLAIKEIKGIKFGFLGLDLVSKGFENVEKKFIADSDKLVDVLIVGVHWGNEYQLSSNQRQQQWAQEIIDLGADVIVGHHPHVVQEVEIINGKDVFYSLGNFVFDQMWSEETKKGWVIELTYEGSNLVKQDILPIYMSSWAQPEFVSR